MKKFLISCLESRVESDGVLYGRFLFGPVPRGLAVTIGTALRRSLLSEVPGFAITHVEMIGVQHEYSVFPGTRETVIDVLLNLKKLVFTSTTTSRKKALGYISVRGPGMITGHDLKLPPGIQCTNPDQVIAHVADDGYVNLKCVVSSGTNYLIQSGHDAGMSQRFRKKGAKGKTSSHLKDGEKTTELKKGPDNLQRQIFPVDAVFMPVIRVNYMIHSDEDISEYPSVNKHNQDITERVIFEIWTNGTVTPRQALHQAASALIRLFSLFRIQEDPPKPFLTKAPIIYRAIGRKRKRLNPPPDTPHAIQLLHLPNHFLHLDIGILPISPYLYRQLKNMKYDHIGHFLGKSYDELLNISGMTEETLFEILCHLRSYGLQLRPEGTGVGGRIGVKPATYDVVRSFRSMNNF